MVRKFVKFTPYIARKFAWDQPGKNKGPNKIWAYGSIREQMCFDIAPSTPVIKNNYMEGTGSATIK